MTKVFSAFLGVARTLLRALVRDPRTSAPGIVAITIGLTAFFRDPVGFLSNEAAIVAFLAGIGLILAGDSKNK